MRNERPVRARGSFVLYWMTASRRTSWNFALDRAVEWALALDRPLLILEALRCDYLWASDRLHRFVLDGMVENARSVAGSGVLYYPYVEPRKGAGRGLLVALAGHACVVVTDDSPAFFLPSMVAAAARKVDVRLEAVDSNGLLPLRASDRAFKTAYSFRRHLQKSLPAHLDDLPAARPLSTARLRPMRSVPAGIRRRWPPAPAALLAGDSRALGALPIDHSVPPAPRRGGTKAARAALRRFLRERLDRYDEDRNDPGCEATSELSPYLHFGHIGAHEVFVTLMRREGWSPARVAAKPNGSRTGFWGVRKDAEAFLDQLMTWRELSFNTCAFEKEFDSYTSLPAWARATLAKHARDPRQPVYSREEVDRARTHDPIWNAAQRQLVREGRIHNYLRMLWGKKILEWTSSPREALSVMLELNDRYALDGRDPNSISGIFWILGRYDRPWGPERPIFGTVRFMSSANTARKCDLDGYLRRYGEGRIATRQTPV